MEKATGLRRLQKASRYSWDGLRAAYAGEPAFYYEAWLLAVLVPVAVWVAESPLQLALMVASMLLVLIVELLNSAIEAVVDRGGLDYDPLAGRAKDMGSAAVFLSLVVVVLIWGCVLFDNWRG